MKAETALAELRASTRDEHDRIERVLRLTDPMPLARYAAVMAGFDAFLTAWEPRIRKALPARLHDWFDARRRSAFAKADVEWLRGSAALEPPRWAAPAVLALTLDGLVDALGSLYVIEGSALGGRVIAPQLKRDMGLERGAGATYFHGFGADSGAMWQAFRTLAAAEIGESPATIAQACTSARRTFEALIETFACLDGMSSCAQSQDPARP